MKKLSGVFICLLLFTFISSARIIEVADAGITDKLRAVIAAKNAGGAPAATDYTAHANAMGAWFMNSNSGDDTDQTGNGNLLTEYVTSDIPTSATVPAGYSGTSRDIELGDAEWLLVADATELDINGQVDITVCIWIYPESLAATMVPISKWSSTDTDRQYMLIVQNDTGYKAQFWVSSDGTTAGGSGFTSTTFNTATWYHLCGVYDDDEGSGNNVQIWVNGVRENTGAFTAGLNDGGREFRVGCRDDSGTRLFFDGLVDEAIVFNTALNSTQINEIKNSGIDGSKGAND